MHTIQSFYFYFPYVIHRQKAAHGKINQNKALLEKTLVQWRADVTVKFDATIKKRIYVTEGALIKKKEDRSQSGTQILDDLKEGEVNASPTSLLVLVFKH